MFAHTLFPSFRQNEKSFRQNGKSGKLARRARRQRRPGFQPRLERLEDRALLAADLQITKTDNLTTAIRGTSTAYIITVTNPAGADLVTGATVSDVFDPAKFTGVSYTAIATGGATGFSAAGTGNISDTVNMPAGSTITYTATALINPAATGSLSNTATVTPPGPGTDPDLSNNSATDT
ncbi:MAG: DUF11 domain-containing protein, partial [Planctomycetales bacterium]|nr:DUF11 domain-containing protein [Planctomycetales bacterium]